MSAPDLKKPIRLQLVDDHFFVRMGLADSLGDVPEFKVVAQASSGAEAIATFQKHRPDVLILDLQLPDMTGTEVIQELKKLGETPRSLMFSINESEEEIYRAVQAGAVAYLPKSSERETLLAAIFSVARGEAFFPEPVREKLEARMRRTELTPRELELLKLLVAGFSNKEAAAEMKISEPTVKLHAGHIFTKLGVMDRTQAVTTAIQRGIVSLDE